MSLRFGNTSATKIIWREREGCSLIASPFVGARYPTLTPGVLGRDVAQRAIAYCVGFGPCP